MGLARSFKELEVWREAMDLAMLVFHKSKSFPAEERYSLTDQFWKASRSVASNISEAWRKRRYPAAFVSKLSDAETEGAESQTWTEFARRCGYWDDETAREVDQRYEKVLRQLVLMIDGADRWCRGIGNY